MRSILQSTIISGALVVPVVAQKEGLEAGVVIGIVIGVTIPISIITSVMTLLIAYKVTTKRQTQRDIERPSFERDGHGRVRASGNSQTSVLTTRSTRPLTPGHGMYRSVSTSSDPAAPVVKRNSRIKSDFISKWCTENKLTEQTAAALRDAGFHYPEAIKSLQADILPSLHLQIAQECLLKEIINNQKKSSSRSSEYRRESYPDNRRSSNRESYPDEVFARNYHRNNSSAYTGSPHERTMSSNELNLSANQVPLLSLRQNSSHLGTDVMDGSYGPQSIQTVGSQYHGMKMVESNSSLFKGILSDTGLYDLARDIGHEWTHLATLLGIRTSRQEQIKMSHQGNAFQQIYEMLKSWRDSQTGSKHEIKGTLHKALRECGKNDLAELLLEEQVDGSREKITYNSII